ncbi:conserved hypothetical protein [Histoplasma capsulatum var. duboisii H88]|uniref:Myb-like DNA-binding protein n=1 Tax=Ajellomyces capsulatus (strain H88) TaxID=544711 RepID=F0U864_AJEC8|nr:conserved hypothetical protein [Histoplasma capsulatum var. duboisii H88]QSS51897.1 myb-like DNA-binding protein [Histoplasma capsulatum var. duboisii H88]
MPATARARSDRAQRKSEPKQPPNLRRSTRQTRSRSRDDAPASPSKSVATSVSAGNFENEPSYTPTRSNRGGKLRSKSGNNELSPVFESPPANATGRFNTNLTRQTSRRSERSVPESPVDHFNVTGTTLLATDSEHESRELDPSIMIEALPDLYTSAKNALRILTPQAFSLTTILRSLKNATFRARIRRIRETFETQQKYFGGQHFIIVQAIVNIFPSLKHIPWHPDEFIQKANLAQFAFDLIPLRENIGPFSDYHLSYLDESFPKSFLSSFSPPGDDQIIKPGRSDLLAETFQLGLEIRTQRVIAELRSGGKAPGVEFAPDVVLETVFTSFVKNGDKFERLLGWEINGLQDEWGSIPEEFHDEVLERMESIRKCFDEDETSMFAHCDKLESLFPWSEFVAQACKWIRMRANEIDEQLGSQASLDEAVETLQIEADRRSSLDQQGISSIHESTNPAPSAADKVGAEKADVQKPQDTGSAITRKSMFSVGKEIFKSKAVISHLVNLQARIGSSVAGSAQVPSSVGVDQPSESPQTEIVATARDSTPQVSDSGAFPRRPNESQNASVHKLNQDVSPGQRTRQPLKNVSPRPSPSEIVKIAERQRLAIFSQRQRPSFKAPPVAFIDRQADAHRLSPVGSSQSSSGRSRLNGRSRKRQASEVEQNEGKEKETIQPSDEESFETDTRSTLVEKNRKSIAALQVHRKRRRIGTSSPRTQPRPLATPPRQPQSLGGRQRSRVASRSLELMNAVESKTPASTAPEISRRVRKPGGGRIPWSVDECNQLKLLIVRHGPKWAKIKQVDDSLENPQLSIRDQVNLKDKARQMAVDFYKTGQPLPENFERVPLKTDDKRKLREMGITIFEDLPEGD